MSVDRRYNETSLIIDYYNEDGDEVIVSLLYDDVFSGESDDNIMFYIVAAVDDDYYRLESLHIKNLQMKL